MLCSVKDEAGLEETETCAAGGCSGGDGVGGTGASGNGCSGEDGDHDGDAGVGAVELHANASHNVEEDEPEDARRASALDQWFGSPCHQSRCGLSA